MNSKENYKSILPEEFIFENKLPKSVQEGLAKKELRYELRIWLNWMWDMEQSPSQQMAYEAICILEKRRDEKNTIEIDRFINEIDEYVGTLT